MTENRHAGEAARDLRVWVLTNGMAGFETQAIGIAEALGATPEVKRVSPPPPWKWLAPHGPAAPQAGIAPPWPDLLIASGRQSIPYARMIRQRSGGRTFTVVLQDPRVDPAQFDFVWAPAHDRLEGPNVLSTPVSPHRLTRERLAAEAARFAPQVAHLPHPRVAVLLGGTNAAYRLDEAAAARIGAQLAALTEEGAGLMVTPSRRTGAAQTETIRKALTGKPAVVRDGTNDNPYFGFLGLADAVVVTCDSVNMVGEATFTGKPVFVIELEASREGKARKFRRFLDSIYACGAARAFAGRLESWEYTPLNATDEIAEAIAVRLRNRMALAPKG
ncbi:MAG: mitochondrial fission ELM1 family protein [Parvibaculum sp.]|uniref:mitochondrial fission ELM1 family protein n=1 Tax=Parvibaculum sp. TaxID=2024848 RepID=UPI0032ED4644